MWKSQQPIIKTKPTVLNSVKRCSVKGYRQPCPSYECHLTYGAVFGLSNRNFLTIWLENLQILSNMVSFVFQVALGPGTWDLGPGTWDLGPRTWDLGPGTWDLGPGTLE